MDLVKVKEQYDRDGYAIIDNFLSEEEIQTVRSGVADIIDKMDPSEQHAALRTENQFSDEYLLNSADKIRFFFNDGAMDKDGKLLVEKSKSVSRVGYALHALHPTFKKLTFSDKVKELNRCVFGMKDPIVFLSMYVLKPPNNAGKEEAHQDSSRLYTCPQHLTGLWIALEDTTLENGCLWFIPGSHKEGVYGDYRRVRKENPQLGGSQTEFIGIEQQYDAARFVATPVKKGTAILIHGEVVHKSEHNSSLQSREIYTFHMYDQARASYDKGNWLQPTEANTFTPLYSQP